MRLGFTGTREGMTRPQRVMFRALLNELDDGRERHVFRHGSCRGADVEAARIVRKAFPPVACEIVCHPGPDSDPHREQSGVDDEVLPGKKHFARNRDIVDYSDQLIATPVYVTPIVTETMGGTAFTVKYARRQGKPVWIIWPDGTLTAERVPVPESQPAPAPKR